MPFFSKFKSSKPSLALPNTVREGSGAGLDPPKPKPKYRHIPIHAATDSLSGSWAMEDRYKSFTEQEQIIKSCSSLHTTSFLLRGEGSSSCLSSSSIRPVEQTPEVTDSEDGRLTDPYLCMVRADGRTLRSFQQDHDFESVSSSNDESMAYSRYASSSCKSRSLSLLPIKALTYIKFSQHLHLQYQRYHLRITVTNSRHTNLLVISLNIKNTMESGLGKPSSSVYWALEFHLGKSC